MTHPITLCSVNHTFLDVCRTELVSAMISKGHPNTANVLGNMEDCFIVMERLAANPKKDQQKDQQKDFMFFELYDVYYKIHAWVQGSLYQEDIMQVLLVDVLILLSPEEDHEIILENNGWSRRNVLGSGKYANIQNTGRTHIFPRLMSTPDECDFWIAFMDEFLVDHVFIDPILCGGNTRVVDVETQIEVMHRMDVMLSSFDMHWHENALYKWYNEYVLYHLKNIDVSSEEPTPLGTGFVRKAYLYRNFDESPNFTEQLVFLSPTLYWNPMSEDPPAYWSEHNEHHKIEFTTHLPETDIFTKEGSCWEITFTNEPFADNNLNAWILSILINYITDHAKDYLAHIQFVSFTGDAWCKYITRSPFKLKHRLVGSVSKKVWLVQIRKPWTRRFNNITPLVNQLEDTFTICSTKNKTSFTRTCRVTHIDDDQTVTLKLSMPIIIEKNDTFTFWIGHEHSVQSSFDYVYTDPILSEYANPEGPDGQKKAIVFDTLVVSKTQKLYKVIEHTKRCVFEKIKRGRDWDWTFHEIVNNPTKYAFRRRILTREFEALDQQLVAY